MMTPIILDSKDMSATIPMEMLDCTCAVELGIPFYEEMLVVASWKKEYSDGIWAPHWYCLC